MGPKGNVGIQVKEGTPGAKSSTGTKTGPPAVAEPKGNQGNTDANRQKGAIGSNIDKVRDIIGK